MCTKVHIKVDPKPNEIKWKIIPKLRMLDEDRDKMILMEMYLKYKVRAHVTCIPLTSHDLNGRIQYDLDRNTYFFLEKLQVDEAVAHQNKPKSITCSDDTLSNEK